MGSTRYERITNKPSDAELNTMWEILVAITVVCSVATFIILSGIAASPTARRSTFNIFIWFLVLPDFIFSAFCLITCAINRWAPEHGVENSEIMCEWQSMYCTFGLCANPWMNAVTAHELYRLLYANKWAKTYVPPSKCELVRTIGLVFAWSIFVSAWVLFPYWPHQTHIISGMACFPAEYSSASTPFFWGLYIPSILLIPMMYIAGVCVAIWWQGLVKQASRARALAIFFARITLVFALFWVPSIVLLFGGAGESPWVGWAGGAWGHLQGLASAMLCMTKPDIRAAVLKLPNRIASCCCKRAKPHSTRRGSLRDTVRAGGLKARGAAAADSGSSNASMTMSQAPSENGKKEVLAAATASMRQNCPSEISASYTESRRLSVAESFREQMKSFGQLPLGTFSSFRRNSHASQGSQHSGATGSTRRVPDDATPPPTMLFGSAVDSKSNHDRSGAWSNRSAQTSVRSGRAVSVRGNGSVHGSRHGSVRAAGANATEPGALPLDLTSSKREINSSPDIGRQHCSFKVEVANTSKDRTSSVSDDCIIEMQSCSREKPTPATDAPAPSLQRRI